METIKKINLISRGLSEVKYDIIKFPDGETHIKFAEELDRKQVYTVICRITNAEDLWILMQVGHILNTVKVVWDLKILYLMSMRMDRIISFRECFTLDLVASMINSLKPYCVYVLHPHSSRTMLLINNCQTLDVFSPSITETEAKIYNPRAGMGKTAICYPDKGACDRYTMDQGFTWRGVVNEPAVITLKKVRDLETGNIKSIEVDNITGLAENEVPTVITVVDDLCDAGGTFIGAAKLLREKFPSAEINIFVRHAVNHIGVINLSENYDKVYLTNSYSSFDGLHIPMNKVVVCDVVSEISKL